MRKGTGQELTSNGNNNDQSMDNTVPSVVVDKKLEIKSLRELAQYLFDGCKEKVSNVYKNTADIKLKNLNQTEKDDNSEAYKKFIDELYKKLFNVAPNDPAHSYNLTAIQMAIKDKEFQKVVTLFSKHLNIKEQRNEKNPLSESYKNLKEFARSLREVIGNPIFLMKKTKKDSKDNHSKNSLYQDMCAQLEIIDKHIKEDNIKDIENLKLAIQKISNITKIEIQIKDNVPHNQNETINKFKTWVDKNKNFSSTDAIIGDMDYQELRSFSASLINIIDRANDSNLKNTLIKQYEILSSHALNKNENEVEKLKTAIYVILNTGKIDLKEYRSKQEILLAVGEWLRPDTSYPLLTFRLKNIISFLGKSLELTSSLPKELTTEKGLIKTFHNNIHSNFVNFNNVRENAIKAQSDIILDAANFIEKINKEEQKKSPVAVKSESKKSKASDSIIIIREESEKPQTTLNSNNEINIEVLKKILATARAIDYKLDGFKDLEVLEIEVNKDPEFLQKTKVSSEAIAAYKKYSLDFKDYSNAMGKAAKEVKDFDFSISDEVKGEVYAKIFFNMMINFRIKLVDVKFDMQSVDNYFLEAVATQQHLILVDEKRFKEAFNSFKAQIILFYLYVYASVLPNNTNNINLDEIKQNLENLINRFYIEPKFPESELNAKIQKVTTIFNVDFKDVSTFDPEVLGQKIKEQMQSNESAKSTTVKNNNEDTKTTSKQSETLPKTSEQKSETVPSPISAESKTDSGINQSQPKRSVVDSSTRKAFDAEIKNKNLSERTAPKIPENIGQNSTQQSNIKTDQLTPINSPAKVLASLNNNPAKYSRQLPVPKNLEPKIGTPAPKTIESQQNTTNNNREDLKELDNLINVLGTKPKPTPKQQSNIDSEFNELLTQLSEGQQSTKSVVSTTKEVDVKSVIEEIKQNKTLPVQPNNNQSPLVEPKIKSPVTEVKSNTPVPNQTSTNQAPAISSTSQSQNLAANNPAPVIKQPVFGPNSFATKQVSRGTPAPAVNNIEKVLAFLESLQTTLNSERQITWKIKISHAHNTLTTDSNLKNFFNENLKTEWSQKASNVTDFKAWLDDKVSTLKQQTKVPQF